MSSNNKMVKGMLIGAAIGAAVSLFDKETRESFIHNSKQAGKKAIDVMKHPGDYTTKIKGQFDTVKTTIEQITEDIRFVSGKVNELSETTPKIIETIKETKETFSANESPETND